ncbi:MAG: hypothetical protein NTV82_19070 [Candidatus Aminicenantes bacterium]|nr:hypothetical protein [Candidatus Aminicenantes bacterium]
MGEINLAHSAFPDKADDLVLLYFIPRRKHGLNLKYDLKSWFFFFPSSSRPIFLQAKAQLNVELL